MDKKQMAEVDLLLQRIKERTAAELADTIEQAIGDAYRNAQFDGAQRNLRSGEFSDKFAACKPKHLVDVGQLEELDPVVPAEGGTLVGPPGVKRERGGVALPGVDDKQRVTFGPGLVVDAVEALAGSPHRDHC
jgi:hypothetical protein